MRLSGGKQKGLAALSTERGIIAALAIDQRSALRKLFARASGQNEADISVEKMAEFKVHVSRVLTPHASAILLDPEFGLAAAGQRAKNAGLLLAYEKTGYDKAIPGRLPSTLDGFSARRLQREGADAVKVLLYYSPSSTGEINAKKYAWVERIGEECIAADVPFFLEIVNYHDEMDEKGPEFARIKPDAVTRAVEEFCNARYGVDVIKVGVPVNMKYVESGALPLSRAIYSRAQAAAHFRRASDACKLPFIYLSEGVTNETFGDALSIAAEAGSAFSGVLCGRATWQDGVGVFVKDGPNALDVWLSDTGVKNIENVNARLAAAHPWQEKFESIAEGKR
ncbi:MAG: tagatose 1,6-diphosphate aldolase [Acidobacteria bacterium]|nr:tagatose 1,6-diphosphate aldolase [Acidobacteriota bacterium]MBS1865155.1 tagatose 1,6-diphosphate aldolase [Acidobacteriota bacterium]